MKVMSERRCPKCGSLNIHRSRQPVKWKRTLRLLGIIPYRCHDCNSIHHGKKDLKRLYKVSPDENQL
jgi:hypothetical protein